MQGGARNRTGACPLDRGADPATDTAGPHMPPEPPRSHRQSRMLAFVREDEGQVTGSAGDWPGCGGIGGATAPHGPPHEDASQGQRSRWPLLHGSGLFPLDGAGRFG